MRFSITLLISIFAVSSPLFAVAAKKPRIEADRISYEVEEGETVCVWSNVDLPPRVESHIETRLNKEGFDAAVIQAVPQASAHGCSVYISYTAEYDGQNFWQGGGTKMIKFRADVFVVETGERVGICKAKESNPLLSNGRSNEEYMSKECVTSLFVGYKK